MFREVYGTMGMLHIPIEISVLDSPIYNKKLVLVIPKKCVILFEKFVKQSMEFSILFSVHKNVIRVKFPFFKL